MYSCWIFKQNKHVNKKLGIIDLGSYSVKFFIYEIKNGEVCKIFKEAHKTQLALGTFKNDRVNPESLEKTLKAVKSFKNNDLFLDLDDLIVVGTSAIRELKNDGVTVSTIEKELDAKINIISPEEEADLISKGFISQKDIVSGISIDMGGGSTEIAYYKNNKIIKNKSLAFGAVRLQDSFLLSHPPKEENFTKAISYINSTLEKDFTGIKTPVAYGLSGGIKTIFKLHWVRDPELTTLSKKSIQEDLNNIIKLDIDEIAKIPGLPKKRINNICAGLTIILSIMDFFNCETLTWDFATLKDGIIKKYILSDTHFFQQ